MLKFQIFTKVPDIVLGQRRHFIARGNIQACQLIGLGNFSRQLVKHILPHRFQKTDVALHRAAVVADSQRGDLTFRKAAREFFRFAAVKKLT